MTDQPSLRDRIADALRSLDLPYFSRERANQVADAVLAVLPEPADRAAEELRHWKSKLSAVTAGRDSLQRENARLKRELANVDRLRTNADFHLGQEMARRQRAEKAAAGLTADRAAVLREAADALRRKAVHDGEDFCNGIGFAADHLDCMADEQEAADAYDRAFSAPPSAAAAKEIRERLASGTMPRRRAHRMADEAQAASCGRSSAIPSPCSAGDYCCEGADEAQRSKEAGR